MSNKRALSVADVLNYKPNLIPFEDKWADAIGKPEQKGAWIISGASGHGKTSFAMQLGKYFCQVGKRVAYDSIEEGLSESIKKTYIRTGMSDVSGKFILLDKEPIEDLRIRLEKRRSPDVIFIDSAQYTGLKVKEYKELVDSFNNKLFIFISHADGGKLKGALANAIYFDAFVCIKVEGFIAFVTKSRYGKNGEIIISKKKADEHWAAAEKTEE